MAQKRGKVLHKNYSDNIFINCPFDSDYKKIFQSILFTIVDCGFIPRCALETEDSGDIRIDKIMQIIKECKYGVHDISRTQVDPKSKLPRFNMPLELGIFIGCKKYSDPDKSYIILDKDRYRYQKFISDIAGQDIHAHNNKQRLAIEKTRDFLRNKSGRTTIPSGNAIFLRFKAFQKTLPGICDALNWDCSDLHFMDYYYCIKTWLKLNAPQG